jgi:hypothetical protein
VASINAKKRKAAKSREKKDTKRMLVLRYKRGKCCIKCSSKGSSALVLEFHHRNPRDKLRTISRGITVGWNMRTLTNEIRKCVLVCRDCHVETHKFLRIFKVC